MKALHCTEPRERETSFIPATIHLSPFEKLETLKSHHYFVNLHGSIIIQLMLDFNKPIKIINSILSMDQKELTKLFCDPKGSHIIDSYMQSVSVGEKSREKLIYKMMVSLRKHSKDTQLDSFCSCCKITGYIPGDGRIETWLSKFGDCLDCSQSKTEIKNNGGIILQGWTVDELRFWEDYCE